MGTVGAIAAYMLITAPYTVRASSPVKPKHTMDRPGVAASHLVVVELPMREVTGSMQEHTALHTIMIH